MTTPNEVHLWRQEIQHGPEGEANYAWVYDADGEMVCTARTHYAEAIVTRMNALASLQGEDAVERVARIIEPYCPKTHAQYKAAVVLAERILATGLVPDEAAITAYLAQAEKEGWVMVPKENLQFIADMSGERSIRQEARSMLAAAQNGGEPCK